MLVPPLPPLSLTHSLPHSLPHTLSLTHSLPPLSPSHTLSLSLARDKAEKSFSFAYMKIMNNDGSIISDGTHELYVYEVICISMVTNVIYNLHGNCRLVTRSGRILQYI